MTGVEVRETMIREGFDVVPIVNKTGFREYFTFNNAEKAYLGDLIFLISLLPITKEKALS